MKTKEILKENYQQYLCELGSGHEDTKAAKKLYDNYCLAEQETIAKACDVFNDFLNSLRAIGAITATEDWYRAFEKTLTKE